MSTDTELFELCQEVYRRFPNWNDTRGTFKRIRMLHSLEWKEWFIADYNNGVWDDVAEQSTPLFTSDYVLEKLPESLPNVEFNFTWRLNIKKGLGGYVVDYSNEMWVRDHKSYFTTAHRMVYKFADQILKELEATKDNSKETI